MAVILLQDGSFSAATNEYGAPVQFVQRQGCCPAEAIAAHSPAPPPRAALVSTVTPGAELGLSLPVALLQESSCILFSALAGDAHTAAEFTPPALEQCS